MALFPRGVSYKVRVSNFIYCIYLLHKHERLQRKKPGRSSMKYSTFPTGGRCGVGIQEVSDLWDCAQVVSGQREAQHSCQGGGTVLEQLQQRRLLHPRPWGGEDSHQKHQKHPKWKLLGVIATLGLCSPDHCVLERVTGQHLWEAESARDCLVDSRYGKARQGPDHWHQWGGGARGNAQGREKHFWIQTVVKFGYVWLSLGHRRQIEMHTGWLWTSFYLCIFLRAGPGTDARASREHARGWH